MTMASITDPEYGGAVNLTARAKEAMRAFRKTIEQLIGKIDEAATTGRAVSDVVIAAIEDTEAVKKAMFRYYRCLDFKLFDELGDCFTADVTADYGMPGWGAVCGLDGEALVAADGGPSFGKRP